LEAELNREGSGQVIMLDTLPARSASH